MNGPPSSCQVVSAGNPSRHPDLSMTSATGPRDTVFVPRLQNSLTRDRCFQSSARLGGNRDSATFTNYLMNCLGFGPNATSILFCVPKRFVTTGKLLSFTLVT